jgi:hypothetical protein
MEPNRNLLEAFYLSFAASVCKVLHEPSEIQVGTAFVGKSTVCRKQKGERRKVLLNKNFS